MRKTILLLMVVLILCLKLVQAESYFGFNSVSPFNFNKISGFAIASQNLGKDYPIVGMANPSAVYCVDLGYNYKTVDTVNGQYGVCIFPDGSQCKGWEFLEGLCGQNYSYCALNGYNIVTNNTNIPLCINKTTGEEVGSVIDLFGLVGKSIMSEENVTTEELNASVESVSTESTPNPFIPLPSYFDWRGNNGNWMTFVKNQGDCGSCWAFSAIGAYEAEYNIFTNTHTDLYLSEDYVVSNCLIGGSMLVSDSCCGGLMSDVHDYFKNHGIPDNDCVPYQDSNCDCPWGGTCGQHGTCTFKTGYECSNVELDCENACPNLQNRLFKADYSGKITSDSIQEIKEKIFTNGPVSAGIYSDLLPITGISGVYSCGGINDIIDHGVILVGWNDTGQYWIVKNSWGSDWNGDGYFKSAYGDCGIETTIGYSTGFNMVSSGNDVQEFYSQPSPSGTYPISCISQSAIWEDNGESLYGDDSIEEINITNGKCLIVGDDTSGPPEQKRAVNVVSIPQSYLPSSPITSWSPWEYRNKTGYCDGPDCVVETFYSPTCPSGYSPASCLSETGYQINQGLYGEDDIVGMNITPGHGRCQVTVFDSVTPDSEYYRRTGVVCLPNVNPIIIWGDWSLRNDTSGYHDGPNADVETFYGPSCPSNTLPISCLSESANAESEKYYGEDGIVNIEILGGRCVITANDETGAFEQKRRVATVCLDNTPPQYSNPSRSSPSVYSSTTNSVLSITWTDNVAISTVLMESNFTGTPTNYSMTNTGSGVYTFTNVLPAGTFYWKSYANDTSNNLVSSDSSVFTISKATPSLSLTLAPSSTVTYPTQTTATCSRTAGDISSALTLYRGGSVVSNPDIQKLAVGSYTYSCSISATQNYTSGSSPNAYLTVQSSSGGGGGCSYRGCLKI